MHVIGRRDDDGVDVLLLLEHLAVVAVLLEARDLLLDEAPQRRLVVGGRHSARRPRAGPSMARSCAMAWAAAADLAGRGPRRLRRFAPRLEPGVEQVEVDVAERDDVLAHDGAGVHSAHAGDADRRDIDEIARRLKAAPEHVPRDDHECRAGGGRRLDELPAGEFRVLIRHVAPSGRLRLLPVVSGF